MAFSTYRIPFLAACQEAHDRLFPAMIERLCEAVSRLAWRRGGRLRLCGWGPLAAILLTRLHNDRELSAWLASASVHQLLTLWHWSNQFLCAVGSLENSDPQYARAKRLIGRRPTRLRYLRAVAKMRVDGV